MLDCSYWFYSVLQCALCLFPFQGFFCRCYKSIATKTITIVTSIHSQPSSADGLLCKLCNPYHDDNDLHIQSVFGKGRLYTVSEEYLCLGVGVMVWSPRICTCAGICGIALRRNLFSSLAQRQHLPSCLFPPGIELRAAEGMSY
jgi:hypothetical protein